MRPDENMRMNLGQYQIHKVTQCNIPKDSPRTYIFQRRILVGLYYMGFAFKRLNFLM